ncbi:MAG TPA: phosphopantetheine-binding protein [Steroidobacteraceae bacterium]|nr:phosphopantetheine-binding protein [Steroidobacteraceae bacterium]
MTHATTDSIQQRLGAIFADTFHVDVPAPDTDLLDSGIVDSLQFVELLYQLECHFALQLKIEEIDLDDLRSLARVARLVSRRIDALAAGCEAATAQVTT